MTGQTGGPDGTREALAGWAERVGCRLLVLFGSAADPEPAVSPRDVDLAVDFPDLPSADRRLALIGELEDLCGPRPVDVVFLHRDTDPVLRFEVFRRGEPLHEARPGLSSTRWSGPSPSTRTPYPSAGPSAARSSGEGARDPRRAAS